jgi:hypothetical protein
MENKSFTTTLVVDQTPKEVFDAINNVRGWWSEDVTGATDKLNEEFSYHYEDIHRAKIKIIEFVPDQKIAWHVVDNYFNFTKDKKEWTDTKIIFEIEKKGKKHSYASLTSASFHHSNVMRSATTPGQTISRAACTNSSRQVKANRSQRRMGMSFRTR